MSGGLGRPRVGGDVLARRRQLDKPFQMWFSCEPAYRRESVRPGPRSPRPFVGISDEEGARMPYSDPATQAWAVFLNDLNRGRLASNEPDVGCPFPKSECSRHSGSSSLVLIRSRNPPRVAIGSEVAHRRKVRARRKLPPAGRSPSRVADGGAPDCLTKGGRASPNPTPLRTVEKSGRPCGHLPDRRA